MRLSLLYTFLLFSFSTYAQSVIYVTETGRGDRSGTSWTNALSGTSLVDRLMTAPSGTQFWVAGGTYKPTTGTDRNVSFRITTSLGIYGGFEGTETSTDARKPGMYETIFSGNIGSASDRIDNSKQLFLATNVSGTIAFDQITIQDGYVAGSDNVTTGAGVFVTSSNVSTTVRVSNCRFNNNTIQRSLNGGGGFGIISKSGAVCRLLIEGSTFVGSEAGYGGAVNLYTQGGKLSTDIVTSTFERNLANEGGAISGRYVEVSTGNSLRISRCTFLNNRADRGGAVFPGSATSSITNCQFLRNSTTSAYVGGGAVDVSNAATSFSSCLFAGNEAAFGGAIAGNAEDAPLVAAFINCTFAANKASSRGGVADISSSSGSPSKERTVQFTNCIAWGNTAGEGSFFTSAAAQDNRVTILRVSYSIVQGGGYAGTGNLAADPLFVDPATDNYRLRNGSPAINAGDPNQSNVLSDTDLDGNPRLRGARVDIGAYEFDCDSGDCLIVESAQSGGWNQPGTWTCNCIPDKTQSVRILNAHAVTIPDAYTGQAESLKLMGSGSIRIQGTGVVRLVTLSDTDASAYVGSDDKFYAIDAKTGTKKWEYSMKSSTAKNSTLSNGILYITRDSPDGTLYAIDALTGLKKWEFSVNYYFNSTPIVNNGLVYFSSFNGYFYALDESTGSLKWKLYRGSTTYAKPKISNGIAYVSDNSTNLNAVDAITGVEKWTYQAQSTLSAIIINNGLIYAGSLGNTLYAIDANTGVKKWEFLTNGGPIGENPILDQGTLYFGSQNDSRLYALDAITGAKRWEFLINGFGSAPTINNKTLYISSASDKKLYALDAITGAKKWESSITSPLNSPIESMGIVCIGSTDDKKLHAFDATSGIKKWEFLTGGLINKPIVSNGTVYIESIYDKFYALDLATGIKKWEFIMNFPSMPIIVTDKGCISQEE